MFFKMEAYRIILKIIMSKLVHFKCNYDPGWDYEHIAKTLFGSNKCIVQAEKMSTNAHVHFQGYCDLTDRQYEEEITVLSKIHYEMKVYNERMESWTEDKVKPKRPRPVKRHKRSVDEKGFQYLCKEGIEPLFSQGFSVADLRELKGLSDAHVEEMKTGLKEYLDARIYPVDPPSLARKRMRMDALEYYDKSEKRPRPSFQKDVLWVMYKHPQTCDAWKEFVAESI